MTRRRDNEPMEEFLERDNQKYESALINERRINAQLREEILALKEQLRKKESDFIKNELFWISGHAAEDILKENRLLKQALVKARDALEALDEYATHDRDCILSFQEAGEPTSDGGYRVKFKGKWYQAKPIDETPKCNCGFKEALAAIEKEQHIKNLQDQMEIGNLNKLNEPCPLCESRTCCYALHYRDRIQELESALREARETIVDHKDFCHALQHGLDKALAAIEQVLK